MLRNRKLTPLDYSLCCMTVTVESPGGSRVLEGVHFEFTDSREVTGGKAVHTRPFLLVIPGCDPIAPGDKVVLGQGDFPAVVATVKPRYFMGKICHTEARG